MTKPIICEVPCKVLSVDSVNAKNKEGKDVVYYSVSVFCVSNGFCGVLNVSDKSTADGLMSVVGSDVTLICAYNPDYRTLRATNFEH